MALSSRQKVDIQGAIGMVLQMIDDPQDRLLLVNYLLSNDDPGQKKTVLANDAAKEALEEILEAGYLNADTWLKSKMFSSKTEDGQKAPTAKDMAKATVELLLRLQTELSKSTQQVFDKTNSVVYQAFGVAEDKQKNEINRRGDNDADNIQQELMQAVEKNDIATITTFLEDGLDINRKYAPYGGTLLSYAAALGKLDVVRFLLVSGADPNILDNNHNLPLAWTLLKLPDVAQTPQRGGTFWRVDLSTKEARTRATIAELLLKAGSRVNQQDNSNKPDATPLSFLSELVMRPDKPGVSEFKNLKKQGKENSKIELATAAEIKQKLQEAINQPQADFYTIIKILRLKSAEKSFEETYLNDTFKDQLLMDSTLLEFAITCGKFDAVTGLIQLGADVNHKSAAKSPLTLALELAVRYRYTEKANYLNIAKLLLQRGAKFSDKDKALVESFFPNVPEDIQALMDEIPLSLRSPITKPQAEAAQAIIKEKTGLNFEIIETTKELQHVESFCGYDVDNRERDIKTNFGNNLGIESRTQGLGMGWGKVTLTIPATVIPQILRNDFSELLQAQEKQKQLAKQIYQEQNQREIKAAEKRAAEREVNLAETEKLAKDVHQKLETHMGKGQWQLVPEQEGWTLQYTIGFNAQKTIFETSGTLANINNILGINIGIEKISTPRGTPYFRLAIKAAEMEVIGKAQFGTLRKNRTAEANKIWENPDRELKPNLFQVTQFIAADSALINKQFNYRGATPLSVAAVEGNLDAVKRLLDLGANVNLQDRNGNIPLAIMIWHLHKFNITDINTLNNYKQIAILLVKAGSNLELKDNNQTPWTVSRMISTHRNEWFEELTKLADEYKTNQKKLEQLNQQNKILNPQPQPASIPKVERSSFETWLKQKKVIGKSENTQKSGNIRKGAYINYLFEDETDAIGFAIEFGSKAHSSRTHYADNQTVFHDPLTKKFAVLISPEQNQKIRKKYLAASEVKQSAASAKSQLKEIQQRIDIGVDIPHLEKLSSLATNNDNQGWYSKDSTIAFHSSLLNFRALHQDCFSEAESTALHNFSNKLIGNKDCLLSDIEWCANADKSQHGAPALQQNAHELAAKLNHQNEIIIDTGGMSGHRTVTKIWKMGVSQIGLRVQGNEQPHHYLYFQTEYNAGAGADWAEQPKWNPITQHYTTGVIWKTSTKQIKDVKQIPALIQAQRMIMLHKEPRPAWVTKDRAEGYSEPGSPEARNWQQHKDQINFCLSERFDALSKKGAPQLSGNCTLMSLKAFCDDEVDPNVSEELWRYMKEFDDDSTIAALDTKKTELQNKHNLIQPTIEIKPTMAETNFVQSIQAQLEKRKDETETAVFMGDMDSITGKHYRLRDLSSQYSRAGLTRLDKSNYQTDYLIQQITLRFSALGRNAFGSNMAAFVHDEVTVLFHRITEKLRSNPEALSQEQLFNVLSGLLFCSLNNIHNPFYRVNEIALLATTSMGYQILEQNNVNFQNSFPPYNRDIFLKLLFLASKNSTLPALPENISNLIKTKIQNWLQKREQSIQALAMLETTLSEYKQWKEQTKPAFINSLVSFRGFNNQDTNFQNYWKEYKDFAEQLDSYQHPLNTKALLTVRVDELREKIKEIQKLALEISSKLPPAKQKELQALLKPKIASMQQKEPQFEVPVDSIPKHDLFGTPQKAIHIVPTQDLPSAGKTDNPKVIVQSPSPVVKNVADEQSPAPKIILMPDTTPDKAEVKIETNPPPVHVIPVTTIAPSTATKQQDNPTIKIPKRKEEAKKEADLPAKITIQPLPDATQDNVPGDARPKPREIDHPKEMMSFLKSLDIDALGLQASRDNLEAIKTFAKKSSNWNNIRSICRTHTQTWRDSYAKSNFFTSGRHPLADIIYHAVLKPNGSDAKIIYSFALIKKTREDLLIDFKKIPDPNPEQQVALSNYYKNVRYAFEKNPKLEIKTINLSELSNLQKEREFVEKIDAQLVKLKSEDNGTIKLQAYAALKQQIQTLGLAMLNFGAVLPGLRWAGNETIRDQGNHRYPKAGTAVTIKDALCWVRGTGLGETTSEAIYQQINTEYLKQRGEPIASTRKKPIIGRQY